MTEQDKTTDETATGRQSSLSGLFDSPELLRVRVRPAEFARSIGVSKQSVSRWIRDGWVTLYADGRLDPVAAVGQLLRRADPGRMRARWLRQAITEMQQLRDAAADADDRAEAAEIELDKALDRLEWEKRLAAESDHFFEGLKRLLFERERELRATLDARAWRKLISEFEGELAEAWLAEHPDDDLDE